MWTTKNVDEKWYNDLNSNKTKGLSPYALSDVSNLQLVYKLHLFIMLFEITLCLGQES